MNTEISLIVLSFILVLAGAAGVIIPMLPGLPIVWVGMLIFAKATDFVFVTWNLLIIFGVIMLFAWSLDLIIPLMGAKKYNASKYGIYGAILGVILGTIFLGPLGVFIGPLVGAFLGELVIGKAWEEALNSSWGAFLGILIGSAIKLAIIAVVLGILIFALFA